MHRKIFTGSFVFVLKAERLCCPEFKKRPCGCVQKYIIGDGTSINLKDMYALLIIQISAENIPLCIQVT